MHIFAAVLTPLPPSPLLRKCTDIILEGQQDSRHWLECDLQHGRMGMYELMEGKEVNGRGVWQMVGGQENFMYYAGRKHWYISGRADMEAGEAAGWMSVASTALTPDQVTETWQVWPCSNLDGTEWIDAPKVRARMCSAEEKRAAASREAGAGAAAGDGGGEAGEG
jgi:hypothetical protein